MTEHNIDRIKNAINHIKTSLDVDPWAAEIAVEAMQEKMEHFADVGKKDDIRESTKKMNDLIDRRSAIAYAISGRVRTLPTSEDGENWIRVEEVRQSLLNMPSAQQGQNAGNQGGKK